MRGLRRVISIIVALAMAACALPFVWACGDGEEYIDPELVPREQVVRYSEFGAKGDGVTDDLAAICAAHEYANANEIAVAADRGATYYIGCAEDDAKTHEKSAVIMTNTYWQDAKFIIDDKDIPTNKIKNADIFTVKSYTAERKLSVPEGYTLSAGQANVGLVFDGLTLLYIVNKNKKDFIRSGSDQNNGTDRQEVILVDRNGNVSPTTPVTWDYAEVTSLTAYCAYDKPLTISGGDFTTIEKTPYMSYVQRGINVMRSNVTVKKVKHTVAGETPDGSSYSGFYRAERAHNVTFEDCVVWGRCTPVRNGVTQGTYDISAKLANAVTWKDCVQANSIREGWGVMGSNHSRNLSMIGCNVSRFDAHQGVYNATIKDSVLRAITVVGFGKLLIDGVTRDALRDEDYGEAEFMTLRNDYGATWHGDIEIRNSVMNTNAGIDYMIKINWNYNWDYGYNCYMPTTVTLDNVTVNYTGGRKKPYPYFYVFSNLDLSRTLTPEILCSLERPLALTETVTVRGGSEFILTHNKTGLLDGNTQMTVERDDTEAEQ